MWQSSTGWDKNPRWPRAYQLCQSEAMAEVCEEGAVKMAAIYPENIPQETKDLPQWCDYKLEIVDGNRTKIPYSPTTGERASSTDSKTWSSFDTALAAY